MTVTIRLAPLLPTNVAVVQFPDVRKATEAVIEIVNSGVGIRASNTPVSVPSLLSDIVRTIRMRGAG